MLFFTHAMLFFATFKFHFTESISPAGYENKQEKQQGKDLKLCDEIFLTIGFPHLAFGSFKTYLLKAFF